MKIVEMSGERLTQLVDQFPHCRVAVMGDYFLDKYLDVDDGLAELSVETGRPAHQVVAVRCSPGAAGTVVCNLAALGCGQLHAVGFAGDDGEGYDLRKQLSQLGCSTHHLHQVSDRHTPTYLKPREVHSDSLEGEHSRYDTKNRQTTAVELEDLLIDSLHEVVPQVDAVIVLDQVEEQDCGVITRRVRAAVAELAAQRPGCLFWADSRCRITEFKQVTIKPNQFEAVGKHNPLPQEEVELDVLVPSAQRLRAENRAPVVVTRGAAGMLVSDPQWTIVPGVPVDGPIDPTGAGDSVSAGAVLSLCAGASLPEAALVGNLVASVTIQQMGTTGVARPDQLLAAFNKWMLARSAE